MVQSKESDPLRIAIIGAGAIAELGHLPGARLSKGVEVTTIIDKNQQRAAEKAATAENR